MAAVNTVHAVRSELSQIMDVAVIRLNKNIKGMEQETGKNNKKSIKLKTLFGAVLMLK